MYAIIKTGGKQYTVEPGTLVDVEKLEGEPGDKVELPVLFLNEDGKIVTDADELAKVTAEGTIVKQFKGKKAIVFKFKKRKGYKRKKGHRQNLTRLCITNLNGVTADAPKPKAPKAEEPAEQEAPKAEAPKAEAPKAEAPKAEAAAEEQDLTKLTVAQLKDLAKEKDIKLPSGARKAEIIEAIQNA